MSRTERNGDLTLVPRRITRAQSRRSQSLTPIPEIHNSLDVPEPPSVDGQHDRTPVQGKNKRTSKPSNATSKRNQKGKNPAARSSKSRSHSTTPALDMATKQAYKKQNVQFQLKVTDRMHETTGNVPTSPQQRLKSLSFDFTYWTEKKKQLQPVNAHSARNSKTPSINPAPAQVNTLLPWRRTREEFGCEDDQVLPIAKRQKTRDDHTNMEDTTFASQGIDVYYEIHDQRSPTFTHSPSSSPSTRPTSPASTVKFSGSQQSSLATISEQLQSFHVQDLSLTSSLVSPPILTSSGMTADMLELDIGDDSIHTQESGSYPNVTVSSQSVIQDRTLHSTRQAEVIAPMSAPLYPTPSSPVPNFHPADAPSQPEACFEQVEQHAHTENPQESQPAYTRASSLVAPPAEDFISPQTNGPNEEVPDSTNARVEESIDQEMLASNQNTPHVDSLCWPSNLNTYHAKFDVIEESEKIELFAQGLEGSLVTFSRKRLKKGWIESSEEQMARRESNKGFYAILPKKLSEAGDAYNREGDPVECYITNAIYIHCLGLRASTYFQTRRWEIENDPKEPCSLGNFILATPATSSHNFHAASVFWTSFQQATKAEFYEVRKMGRYYTEDSVRHLFRVVVDAQIAFQTAAHSNTASEEDRNHYRRERSNARRIAKWISLCFVAEFSGQKMLLENIRIGGADLCSSEESGVDENEDVILKTKLLSWRSQKLENFLSLLRQRTLYYKGPPNGSQANQHKKSERIPPVHVPKDWVHTSWLESIPTRL